MRLAGRVKKLEAAVSRCDGQIKRIVRGDVPLMDADRCRICGGCHVLVIHEVIVERGPDGHPVPVAESEDEP